MSDRFINKLACLFFALILGGGAGFIGIIASKMIINIANIPEPWEIIVIFGLIIGCVVVGVTAAYLIFEEKPGGK